MPRSRLRRTVLFVATGLVIALTASGLTYAATTTSPTYVYGCVNKYRTLRLLSSTGTCSTGYTKIAINQVGPRGLQGVQGPGAVAVSAGTSSTRTTSFADSPLIGTTGLRVHLVCLANSSTGVYIFDNDGSAAYNVDGTTMLGAGGSALLVYNGGAQGALPVGPGLISFLQPAQHNANAEFVLNSGTLTGRVLVTRTGKTFTIDFVATQSPTRCDMRAQITPAS